MLSSSNTILDLAASISDNSFTLSFSSLDISVSWSTSSSSCLSSSQSFKAHRSFTKTFSISKINLSLSRTLLTVNLGPLVRMATSSALRSLVFSPTITGPLTSPGTNSWASTSLKTLASLYLLRMLGSSNLFTSFQDILIILFFLMLSFLILLLSLFALSLTILMCLL